MRMLSSGWGLTQHRHAKKRYVTYSKCGRLSIKWAGERSSFLCDCREFVEANELEATRVREQIVIPSLKSMRASSSV
jgi:hypothetical protein